jgi:DNA-binding NarL/FixJ family response regulator
MTTRSIRLLYIDDQQLVREGIIGLIEREMDVAAVGRDAFEVVAHFSGLRPDVTLVGLPHRGLGGVDIIRDIRRLDPDARIVVLTAGDCGEALYYAWEAGAIGFVLKRAGCGELFHVIREAHAGRRWIPEFVEASLRAHETDKRLSAREIDILRQLALGKSNKEIASALGISDQTVKAHVKALLLKLNVRGRTHALAEGIRRGLLHIGAI